MQKHYTYTFHLPDGTHISTAPYRDLIALRKAAMCLLTSLDLDPLISAVLKEKASDSIAELKDSIKEATKQTRAVTKEKERAECKTAGLKKPGKPLGSSYAYIKEWRKENPEKFAASKAKAKANKEAKQKAAGLL